MGPFDYLFILVSIVIGLGITQLLSGLGRALLLGRRVVHDCILWLWAAILFIAEVELWWSDYRLHDVKTWTFYAFLVRLLPPVVMYLLTVLLFPDFSDNKICVFKLRQHFWKHRRLIFGLAASVPALNALNSFLLHCVQRVEYQPQFRIILGFQAAFVGLLLSLCFSRSEKYDTAISILVLLLLLVLGGIYHRYLPLTLSG